MPSPPPAPPAPAVHEFLTVWRLTAPLPAVWEALSHSERWPRWWRGLVSVVELRRGDEAGIGNLRRFTWRGLLPYRLTFDVETVRIEPLTLIEGKASGDVTGSGVWRLARETEATAVRYEWRVAMTGRGMQALMRYARPLVRINHDAVMRWGGTGLARLLGARLCGLDTACVRVETGSRPGAHPPPNPP